VRLRRLSDFSRGVFLAAAGGENGSHYFKNTGHFSKDFRDFWEKSPRRFAARLGGFAQGAKPHNPTAQKRMFLETQNPVPHAAGRDFGWY